MIVQILSGIHHNFFFSLLKKKASLTVFQIWDLPITTDPLHLSYLAHLDFICESNKMHEQVRSEWQSQKHSYKRCFYKLRRESAK